MREIGKLVDPWFEAKLFRLSREGEPRGHVDVATLDEAHGVFFYCPCSYGKSEGAHACAIPFSNPRAAGGIPVKGWAMTGTSLADLTLAPSLLVGAPECWHGFIQRGTVYSI